MKVELRDIRKYFGPVKANDGISLTLEGVAFMDCWVRMVLAKAP